MIGNKHPMLIRHNNDDWMTPRHILDALGKFDLDPATPINRPWDTADRHFSSIDDGLAQNWSGRVWLNPPYSKPEPWLRRLADHGNGVALVFARTDTRWFAEQVWARADALLFIRSRLAFVRADLEKSAGGHNAAAPSVLVAYGKRNVTKLRSCGIGGAFVPILRP